MTKQSLIKQLGDTNALYLTSNTPSLAKTRTTIRLKLAKLSTQQAERLHFIHEAIVIAEQACMQFDKTPLDLHISLSVVLAQAYLAYFEATEDIRYAVISEQILRPLSHYGNQEVYAGLTAASLAQNKPALARHWQAKLQCNKP